MTTPRRSLTPRKPVAQAKAPKQRNPIRQRILDEAEEAHTRGELVIGGLSLGQERFVEEESKSQGFPVKATPHKRGTLLTRKG